MIAYDTMVEALNALNKKGYTCDFNASDEGLFCQKTNQFFKYSDITSIEYYRFEGFSDPGDLSDIYAIETVNKVKGVLVDGYGISATVSYNIIQKLQKKGKS